MLLDPGVYKGKIADYGIRRTKKGDPAPTIAFVVELNGAQHRVFWQGSWNGQGMDICMEALLVCGLRSAQDLMYVAEGKSSGVLDTDSFFEITIEVDVNQDDPLKRYNKVKWINAEGGKKFKDAITVQEFAPEINGRNLVADLMRVAQAKGFTLSNGPVRTPRSQAPEVNIPF